MLCAFQQLSAPLLGFEDVHSPGDVTWRGWLEDSQVELHGRWSSSARGVLPYRIFIARMRKSASCKLCGCVQDCVSCSNDAIEDRCLKRIRRSQIQMEPECTANRVDSGFSFLYDRHDLPLRSLRCMNVL
jgi:hypothetical protein